MPGIGKTTSIHCLAHQLLGDAYKEGVLELNASDERRADPRFPSLTDMLMWHLEVSMSSEIKSRPLRKRR